jgi:hypothetical protein
MYIIEIIFCLGVSLPPPIISYFLNVITYF